MAGLIVAVVALGIGVVVLTSLLISCRLRTRKLTDQIEAFIAGKDKVLPVSVREDSLAPLHNAVAELENTILVARDLQNQECRRTGDLMADISHQLKTPLASLRLFCEMDNGAHIDDEIKLVEKMERLVYALLRLERLCADGYSFDFAEHDVPGLVHDAWQSLAPQYADKQLTITGSEKLHCDEKWLGEAFLNILKNACEHTAEDGRIAVSIESTDKACFITFEDNGGGASAKDLPHLFERFYRAEGSKAEGSGIGLSMAREIVRHHQGTISAENAADGLRIVICIPLLQNMLVKS